MQMNSNKTGRKTMILALRLASGFDFTARLMLSSLIETFKLYLKGLCHAKRMRALMRSTLKSFAEVF